MFSRVARALAASGDLDGAIEAASWSLAAGHEAGHFLLGGLFLAAARPVDAYAHIRTHLGFAPVMRSAGLPSAEPARRAGISPRHDVPTPAS